MNQYQLDQANAQWRAAKSTSNRRKLSGVLLGATIVIGSFVSSLLTASISNAASLIGVIVGLYLITGVLVSDVRWLTPDRDVWRYRTAQSYGIDLETEWGNEPLRQDVAAQPDGSLSVVERVEWKVIDGDIVSLYTPFDPRIPFTYNLEAYEKYKRAQHVVYCERYNREWRQWERKLVDTLIRETATM